MNPSFPNHTISFSNTYGRCLNTSEPTARAADTIREYLKKHDLQGKVAVRMSNPACGLAPFVRHIRARQLTRATGDASCRKP